MHVFQVCILGSKGDIDMLRHVTHVVITDANIKLCDCAFTYLH
jgi:hypothetical protein